MSNNKKNIHVTQVKLEKVVPGPSGDVVFTDIAWIPSKLATTGKTLRVLHNSDEWVDGWVVKKVYETRIYQEALDDENNYKTQREASDSYDNQGPVATAFMKG